MWELQQALERWSSKDGVRVLPVLMDNSLTLEDLKDLSGRVYNSDSSWGEKRPRPLPVVLEQWAALGKQVASMQFDQVRIIMAGLLSAVPAGTFTGRPHLTAGMMPYSTTMCLRSTC